MILNYPKKGVACLAMSPRKEAREVKSRPSLTTMTIRWLQHWSSTQAAKTAPRDNEVWGDAGGRSLFGGGASGRSVKHIFDEDEEDDFIQQAKPRSSLSSLFDQPKTSAVQARCYKVLENRGQ
eukprot:g30308.t1